MRSSSRNFSSAGLALWAALLLGSPYLLGMRPIGGSAAYSPMYPLIACAILMGMWFAARPAVRARVGGWASQVLLDVGVFLAALFIIPEWLNVALMSAGSGLVSAVRAAAIKGVLAPQALYDFSTTFEMPLALAAAFACGMQTQLAMARADAFGRTQQIFPLSPVFQGTVATVAFTVFGLIQPVAWIVWLPHGEYPLMPVTSDVSLNNLLWGTSSLLTVVPLSEQLTLCACSLLDSKRPVRHEAPSQPWCLPSSYPLLTRALVGEILGYVLICAFPALRTVGQTEAVVFATVQAIIVAAIPFSLRAMHRNALRANHVSDCDAQATTPCQTADLGKPFRDALLQRGLTNREADSVSLTLAGLSSAQAAQLLSIRSSSVREYNRRACKKLGVSSLDDLREGFSNNLRQSQNAEEPPASKRVSERKTFSVSHLVTVICLATALLPIPYISLTSGNAFSVVLGALLGLAGVGLAQPLVQKHESTHCIVQAALMTLTVASCVCSLVLRLTPLPSNWGNGVLMLCTAILVTAGLTSFGQSNSSCSMPLFSCVLGWTWSNAWLSLSNVGFLPWAAIAPLLTLDIALALTALGQKQLRRIFLAALASIALCLFTTIAAALLLFGMTLLFLQTNARGTPRGTFFAELNPQHQSAYQPTSACVFGVGLSLAFLAFKLWLLQTALPVELSSLIVTVLVVIVSFLLALIPLIEWWRIARKGELPDIHLGEVAPDDSRRMEGFLISRGLTPRQVSVTLQTAQGTSLEEVGQALNLSRTAVYTARKEAFAALGVHTTAELATLLRQAIR